MIPNLDIKIPSQYIGCFRRPSWIRKLKLWYTTQRFWTVSCIGFRKYILLGIFICIFNEEIGIMYGKWVFYVLYLPLPIKALYKGFRPQNGPTLLHSMGNIFATVIVTDSIFFAVIRRIFPMSFNYVWYHYIYAFIPIWPPYTMTDITYPCHRYSIQWHIHAIL